jgi:hypothetical protein
VFRIVFTSLLVAAALSSTRVAGADVASQGREHWAFRAPRAVAPPTVKDRGWCRTPVDAFVLARLEKEGLRPAPEADRATLIRRLHLDLTGLPPASARVEAFVRDRAPDAYERLVEELLASPHFGERWARHWLDLARYADSCGYQLDHLRPGAFLYRDWVIEAVAEDLPYDQFVIQQMAGDLLPDATLETRIATGFHRMTLENREDGVDAAEFAAKAKADRVGTTGTTFLGLTLACAECHSHKYDPVSQREFFQLYAFFDDSTEVELSPVDGTESPAPPPRKRARSKEVKALALAANTNPPPTHVHVRGDFLQRGEAVRPGALEALQFFQPRGARADRLDLARWIASPQNPLTARVAVNHVWQHLFGRGLVATPEDFGTRGSPPSHAELLDWLAVMFSGAGEGDQVRLLTSAATGKLNWSRKELIRLLVNSAAYRQSSRLTPAALARDPDNVLLARQGRWRVESEIVRDLHLAVGGLLQTDIGGPAIRPPMPPDLHFLGYIDRGVSWETTPAPAVHRRGIYVQVMRTIPHPVPMAFDAADANESCARRESSNSPLQPLALLNNGAFVECAEAFAQRILAAGKSSRARAAFAFREAMGRDATAAELSRLSRFAEMAAKQAAPEKAALALAQVVFNLDEFLTRE